MMKKSAVISAALIACLSIAQAQKFFSKVDVFEEYVKTNESPDKGYTFVKQNMPNEFGKNEYKQY